MKSGAIASRFEGNSTTDQMNNVTLSTNTRTLKKNISNNSNYTKIENSSLPLKNLFFYSKLCFVVLLFQFSVESVYLPLLLLS